MKKLCLTLLAIFVFAVSANAAVVIPIDKSPGQKDAPPTLQKLIENGYDIPNLRERLGKIKQDQRKTDLLLKYLSQNPNTTAEMIESLVDNKMHYDAMVKEMEAMLPPKPKKEPRKDMSCIPDLSAMQALISGRISDHKAAVEKDMPARYAAPKMLGAFAKTKVAPCPLKNDKRFMPGMAPCPLKDGKHVVKHPPMLMPTPVGPMAPMAVMGDTPPPPPCPCH